MARLRQFYTEFSGLLALLLLFSTFRLFAILLFRPGGFFADNSDYDFYSAWGLTQVAMGYTTFETLWTAYPPLFPAVMLPLFEWSSRIPPWVEPRLFFHLLFGALLLLFEIANLLLIYRLAWRLEEEAGGQPAGAALRAAVFYALLFAPVYTLLGWFEAMPLFFLLWGLDLLVSRRRGGWLASAVAAALGFLVKLTPVLLVPVA
ncbi:MAG: glycosyltransferase 87 family protein, partial [Caldilinea sp.]|nr:glycosyltransferase 87 family protein [Caldilinea sp.]